jgi:hypothetical protein
MNERVTFLDFYSVEVWLLDRRIDTWRRVPEADLTPAGGARDEGE